MSEREVQVSSSAAPFEQAITVGPHRLVGDEPPSSGGSDAGPSPHELLLAALGCCTSMTVAMYARRKEWPLEHVDVVLTHSRPPAEGDSRPPERIERRITLSGPLSEEQKARLLEIAEKCPVHRTLTGELDIRTRIA